LCSVPLRQLLGVGLVRQGVGSLMENLGVVYVVWLVRLVLVWILIVAQGLQLLSHVLFVVFVHSSLLPRSLR
jgi:hypothetical protein